MKEIARSRSFLALLVCTLASAGTAMGQSKLHVVDGNTSTHHLGTALARFHDLDGDGWREFLAGMPGEVSTDMGRVRILSGRFLATGAGAAIHSSIVGPSSEFGRSVIGLGDFDGNGVFDFAAGSPNDVVSSGFGFPAGSVLICDALGNTLGMITAQLNYEEFGTALALLPDLNGDGVKELLVGSPGFTGGIPSVFKCGKAGVYSGAHALLDQEVVLRAYLGDQPNERFGSAVATGFFDGDAVMDYVIATPHRPSSGGVPDSGRVSVYSGATGALIRTIFGGSGTHFGASVASGLNVTSDGVHDLIIGAPFASSTGTQSGSAFLYSGAGLASGGILLPLRTWHGPSAGAHFGAAVALVQDLNADGDADAVVGAPDYAPVLFGNDNGQLRCYSGETGELMGVLTGAADEHLGGAFTSADHLDSNPGWEFLVGSPDSTLGLLPGGRVASVSIFPNTATTYCTAKTNSLGCVPGIQAVGTPSVTPGVHFNVKATNVLNNVPSILVYALDAGATPFQGGFLCVGLPLKRVKGTVSGGNPPPALDCSGAPFADFNFYVQSGADVALVAGQEVFTQIWSRDANSTGGSSLSAGLRFLIHP